LSKWRAVNLTIVLLLSLTSIAQLVTLGGHIAASAQGGGTVVWSANYETGDQSQFISAGSWGTVTGKLVNECGGTLGVSSISPPTNGGIVHSGNYAGYYSGNIPKFLAGGGVLPLGNRCHVTPDTWSIGGPGKTHSDFYEEVWFYVPTQLLVAETRTYSNNPYVSFFGFGDRSEQTFGINSATASSGTLASHDLVAYSVNLRRTFTQNVGSTPVQWPFDAWFKLGILVHNLGTAQASFIVYFDDSPIMDYSNVAVTAGPMYSTHAGAYWSIDQGTWAIYNDDLLFEDLSLTSNSSVAGPSSTVSSLRPTTFTSSNVGGTTSSSTTLGLNTSSIIEVSRMASTTPSTSFILSTYTTGSAQAPTATATTGSLTYVGVPALLIVGFLVISLAYYQRRKPGVKR